MTFGRRPHLLPPYMLVLMLRSRLLSLSSVMASRTVSRSLWGRSPSRLMMALMVVPMCHLEMHHHGLAVVGSAFSNTLQLLCLQSAQDV